MSDEKTEEKPKVRVGKISEFRPQVDNANLHTLKGEKLLDESMREDGYLTPMTSAKDGELIDGSSRLEKSADIFTDEVLIVEHDGSRPIVMVRTDIETADTERAKRLAIRANRVGQENLNWNEEILAEYAKINPELMTELWGQDAVKEWEDLYNPPKVGDEEDEQEKRLHILRRDVPDAIWPTDNDWGVPSLDIALQAGALSAPVVIWGSVARTTRMRGTWMFYTDDYRFTGLWEDPSNVVNSGCMNIFEPNFSCYSDMPLAVGLWAIYRKRWLSRFYQSYGIKVFADLNVAPEFYDLNMLGIPKGWRAFSTRGYNERLEFTEQEYEMALKRSESESILFVVYGGGKLVEERCRERGWIWIKEDGMAHHRITIPGKEEEIPEKEEVVEEVVDG